ncbi:aminotransferase class I/II-fold pyridoxal phosphate-dependent enzyme, partial [Bacillus cereus]|uniref:aminotransferase class I/II-fold pyridoxal phosphate-dependent enzyme n=1 Tax=Bacillus cereus TaxID=1396 RepID=UPI002850E106
LDVAMRAIINPDVEVLIVGPSFFSYAAVVTLAGVVPVPVATELENEFKVLPEQVEAAITAKTKAILLCSPNSPTGAMLNKFELEEIAVIVAKYNLIVVS